MAKIYHFDLYGSREDKYKFLEENNINTIEWKEINPVSPFYLFIPQNTDLLSEYNQGWKITEIMPVNSVGIVTARDGLTIQNTPEEVEKTVKDFVSLSVEEAREKYNLGKDSRDWKIQLAQNDLRKSGLKNELITPILYRPFDTRYTYYTGTSSGFICRSRNEIMRNMLSGENLGLLTSRQLVSGFKHIFVTSKIANFNSLDTAGRFGTGPYFPLYIYPETNNEQSNLFQQKTPNFSPEFVTAITEKLGYLPTPENIFYYMYAILHSPTYRERYAEFLKMDFPRIPLTSNDNLFRKLTESGEKLVNLHLMKNIPLTKGGNSLSDFPLFQGGIKGGSENLVTQVKYDPKKQRIYINQTSYFSNITEEVWHFKIGGYQVLDKWLKDRKKVNRSLTPEAVNHYQKIVIIIQETLKLMTEIDVIIGIFPIK